MNPERVFQIQRDDAGRRLDRVLRLMFPRIPLGALYRAVRVGQVRVEGRRCGPDRILLEGEKITVEGDLGPQREASGREYSRGPGREYSRGPGRTPFRPIRAGERDLPSLDALIVHRNPHFLALNKPRGMPTHGLGSLEQIVRRDLAGLLPPSLSFKPGPLHRLDAGTTGLLLFSASLEGSHAVTAAFRQKRVEKTYIAVFDGIIAGDAAWRDVLARDGKDASMEVRPLTHADGLTLALCFPATGRYHQIRIQGALRGHPLCGDRKHGGSDRLPWFLLHCASIRFTPPLFGVTALSVRLPPESERIIADLFGRSILPKLLSL